MKLIYIIGGTENAIKTFVLKFQFKNYKHVFTLINYKQQLYIKKCILSTINAGGNVY